MAAAGSTRTGAPIKLDTVGELQTLLQSIHDAPTTRGEDKPRIAAIQGIYNTQIRDVVDTGADLDTLDLGQFGPLLDAFTEQFNEDLIHDRGFHQYNAEGFENAVVGSSGKNAIKLIMGALVFVTGYQHSVPPGLFVSVRGYLSGAFSTAIGRMAGVLGTVGEFAKKLVGLLLPAEPESFPSVQAAVDTAIGESGIDITKATFDQIRLNLIDKIKYVPSPDIVALRPTQEKLVNAYELSGKNEILARILFAIALHQYRNIARISNPYTKVLIQMRVIDTYAELLMTLLEHAIYRQHFNIAYIGKYTEAAESSQTTTNTGGEVGRPANYSDLMTDEIRNAIQNCTTAISGPPPAGVVEAIVRPTRTLIGAIGLAGSFDADLSILTAQSIPIMIERFTVVQRAVINNINAPRELSQPPEILSLQEARRKAQAVVALATEAIVPVGGGAASGGAGASGVSHRPNITGFGGKPSPSSPQGTNFTSIFDRSGPPSCKVTAKGPDCSNVVAALADGRVAVETSPLAASVAATAASMAVPVVGGGGAVGGAGVGFGNGSLLQSASAPPPSPSSGNGTRSAAAAGGAGVSSMSSSNGFGASKNTVTGKRKRKFIANANANANANGNAMGAAVNVTGSGAAGNGLAAKRAAFGQGAIPEPTDTKPTGNGPPSPSGAGQGGGARRRRVSRRHRTTHRRPQHRSRRHRTTRRRQ